MSALASAVPVRTFAAEIARAAEDVEARGGKHGGEQDLQHGGSKREQGGNCGTVAAETHATGRRLRGEGRSVFTPSELRIVSLLYERRYGAPVTRRDIADALYGDDPDGGAMCTDGSISKFLSDARPKLAALGCRIETNWGRGYRLVRL
jgi:DNA-binding response OmpR family regulator